MRVLLVSTYELGRQPFGLASPAAWLRDADLDVRCLDVSRERLDDVAVRQADVVAFYLPMHTATRLAMPAIERVRDLNPHARLAAFGLYAPLNEEALRAHGVQAIFSGEFEQDLTAWALNSRHEATPGSPRLAFRVPDRSSLPPLNRYAGLMDAGGVRHVVGYTEASRGCKHWCRHCPIVPVYQGRFRIVPREVVMADVRAQVAAGAEHITFGDPDFFNGIGHATAVVRELHREFPHLTYDVTIKVEHLLAHRRALPLLAETGCLFVTSAVESVDDAVLARLRKGHTRRDVERAVSCCREVGLALAPTFVPFTPWTTPAGYVDLLQTIAELALVEQVAPIQLAIRLLLPAGSPLLDLDDVRELAAPFDQRALAFPWRHMDPRVDALQREVETIVGARLNGSRREIFGEVWQVAQRANGTSSPPPEILPARAATPYLTEPWYC